MKIFSKFIVVLLMYYCLNSANVEALKDYGSEQKPLFTHGGRNVYKTGADYPTGSDVIMDYDTPLLNWMTSDGRETRHSGPGNNNFVISDNKDAHPPYGQQASHLVFSPRDNYGSNPQVPYVNRGYHPNPRIGRSLLGIGDFFKSADDVTQEPTADDKAVGHTDSAATAANQEVTAGLDDSGIGDKLPLKNKGPTTSPSDTGSSGIFQKVVDTLKSGHPKEGAEDFMEMGHGFDKEISYEPDISLEQEKEKLVRITKMINNAHVREEVNRLKHHALLIKQRVLQQKHLHAQKILDSLKARANAALNILEQAAAANRDIQQNKALLKKDQEMEVKVERLITKMKTNVNVMVDKEKQATHQQQKLDQVKQMILSEGKDILSDIEVHKTQVQLEAQNHISLLDEGDKDTKVDSAINMASSNMEKIADQLGNPTGIVNDDKPQDTAAIDKEKAAFGQEKTPSPAQPVEAMGESNGGTEAYEDEKEIMKRSAKAVDKEKRSANHPDMKNASGSNVWSVALAVVVSVIALAILGEGIYLLMLKKKESELLPLVMDKKRKKQERENYIRKMTKPDPDFRPDPAVRKEYKRVYGGNDSDSEWDEQTYYMRKDMLEYRHQPVSLYADLEPNSDDDECDAFLKEAIKERNERLGLPLYPSPKTESGLPMYIVPPAQKQVERRPTTYRASLEKWWSAMWS